jgi:hypothetical protein
MVSEINTGARSFGALTDGDCPVLKVKASDALEFALIVGDESEPGGFGVSSNPEIVSTDHLTVGL